MDQPRFSSGYDPFPIFFSTRYASRSDENGGNYGLDSIIIEGGKYSFLQQPNSMTQLHSMELLYEGTYAHAEQGRVCPMVILPKSRYIVRLEAVNDQVLKILGTT